MMSNADILIHQGGCQKVRQNEGEELQGYVMNLHIYIRTLQTAHKTIYEENKEKETT